MRPGKDYVNGSGETVLAEWPNAGNGGGWKPFTGASVTMLLDPLAADNAYLLQLRGPGDTTGVRKMVHREEYRQVLAGTANGTSWYALTRVSGVEPDSTPLQVSGFAAVMAAIADLQAQISAIVVGGGGASTLAGITDMSAFMRTVNDDTTAAVARATLGAGTSSLALGTTSTTAKVGDYQPASANISDASTIGKTILTAADAAAVRTAIGAGSSGLVIGTTTGTAADGGTVTTLTATVAGKAATSHAHVLADLTGLSADVVALLGAADFAAIRTLLGALTSSDQITPDQLPPGAVMGANGPSAPRPTARTDIFTLWTASVDPANEITGDIWFNGPDS